MAYDGTIPKTRAARPFSFFFFALLMSFAPNASADSVGAAVSPFSALEDIFEFDSSYLNSTNAVSVLDYLRSTVSRVGRIPDYDRSTDFGAWIYPDPTVCKNTRALVLIRDADRAAPIHYTNTNECAVLTGLWHDSYTGKDVKKARDLDIDHVVPLHNAWTSGAYRWDGYRRCHYANFMENKIHLRAVSSTQNRAKGDKTPADFMPEDRRAACVYLADWMKIKTIWELSATPEELSAIEAQLQANRCAPQDLLIDGTDLLNQRQISSQPQKACAEVYNQPRFNQLGF